jgi:hypothetical protein
MYWFCSKLVCLAKQGKVTDNRKDTSLLRIMYILNNVVILIYQGPVSKKITHS